jgi:hypothetical protein
MRHSARPRPLGRHIANSLPLQGIPDQPPHPFPALVHGAGIPIRALRISHCASLIARASLQCIYDVQQSYTPRIPAKLETSAHALPGPQHTLLRQPLENVGQKVQRQFFLPGDILQGDKLPVRAFGEMNQPADRIFRSSVIQSHSFAYEIIRPESPNMIVPLFRHGERTTGSVLA